MRNALLIGLIIYTVADAQAYAEQSGIADVLPKKPGQATCFAADIKQPVAMDIEDWSEGKVTMEPVPGETQKDGKPLMRPVPTLLKGRKMTSLAMQIEAEDVNPSEPFGFLMRLTIQGWKKPLYAAGSCAPAKDDAGKIDERRLGCFIECDGGSAGLARVPDTASVAVLFSRDGGLRMTAGCGDEAGPSHRVKAAAGADQQAFRLALVAAKRCAPLRAWLKQQ